MYMIYSMFAVPPPQRRFSRIATLAGLFVAVGVMTTLVSYSVTLYRLFCQATGALGTTARVVQDSAVQAPQQVTVSFDTNVAPGMPWRFRAVQDSVKVHLGQSTLVFFEAENLSDQPIVGHATFNVSPGRVGLYFKKTQCFCFSEERLGPHQKVEMPVSFFVDPKMADDVDAKDVHFITLSYTFFRSMDPQGAQDLARFDGRPPDATAGRQVFETTCNGCHALDRNKVGPALGGVFGRKAGSVPGYAYSAALAHADIVWSAETLDQWLAGPKHFVPGAQMPLSLPDKLRRQDVIAYLKTLQAPAERPVRPAAAAPRPS